MSEAIIVALITGGIAVITTIISGKHTSNDMQHKLETHQAVTDEKITELTREVRLHNGFAERVPILEERIKVANHRLDDLERGGK